MMRWRKMRTRRVRTTSRSLAIACRGLFQKAILLPIVMMYELRSATVKRRDEADLVAILQLVVELALEFPIGVIDENENARPSDKSQEEGESASSST